MEPAAKSVTLSETYFLLYLSLVKELVEELNREGGAGLITNKALLLSSQVDQHTRKLARIIHNAQANGSSQ